MGVDVKVEGERRRKECAQHVPGGRENVNGLKKDIAGEQGGGGRRGDQKLFEGKQRCDNEGNGERIQRRGTVKRPQSLAEEGEERRKKGDWFNQKEALHSLTRGHG